MTSGLVLTSPLKLHFLDVRFPLSLRNVEDLPH